jgi:glyoxylate reductase
MVPVDAALLEAAPALRVVSGYGVGYDNFDIAAATARGVAICNTPDVLTEAVADFTLGALLAFTRRIVANNAYVASGAWSARQPGPPLGVDLAGKTLGIVGYGRIGRAVARRARAFSMRILFHDLFSECPPEHPAEHHELDKLLAASDIVSVHVNLTPETHHLIGARELALMRPTAIVVNTSRGPVIDEVALAAALRAGTIAGAVLDVLEAEPPAPDAPILSAPNALLFPHVASATVETRQAMLDLAVSNLLAVLAGEIPPACVNPEALERALRR